MNNPKIAVSIEKYPTSNQVKVSSKEGKDRWFELFSTEQYNAIREAILLDAEMDGLVTIKTKEA